MSKFAAAVFCGLVFCASGLFQAVGEALAYEPTNFAQGGYPVHNCRKPELPDKSDEQALLLFQAGQEQYKICIMRYLAAAQADHKRVMDRANQAVDEYNGFLESLKE